MESLLRIAVALHLHDFELARLFVIAPTLHDASWSIPCLAPSSLWEAPSAIEWLQAMQAHVGSSLSRDGASSSPISLSAWSQLGRSDPINVAIRLEHISSVIIDNQRMGPSAQINQYIEESLLTTFTEQLRDQRPDPLSIRPLWHSTYILLFADIRRLEIVVGKNGSSKISDHLEYATNWAAAVDSQRAVLHGALLLRYLEPMPIRSTFSIHVPSSLYHAALVWYCYLVFCPQSRFFYKYHPDSFPELAGLGADLRELNNEIHEYKNCRPTPSESTVLLGLIDMLRRAGYWGISRSLASLLTLLVKGSTSGEESI